MHHQDLPVAVIGAGPVGLAAAVHLLGRGLQPVVFEAGEEVAAHVRQWGHVRMFSPWQYNIDPQAARLLAQAGWQAPEGSHYPTGAELYTAYLAPLASLPAIQSCLMLGASVTAVSRLGHDLMKNGSREHSPFLVRYKQDGREQQLAVQAVIDASGTYATPNPMGVAGIPAVGERAASQHFFYGIPDVHGRHRHRYAGKRVVVVGSGHSAFNVLTELVSLAESVSDMQLFWAIRRASLSRVLGGGEKDQLKERGKLGQRIASLVSSEKVTLLTDVQAEEVLLIDSGVQIKSGTRLLPVVDEVIVTTGFRPDLAMLGEIRLGLDSGTQSPVALAPMIDPNLHSCGTVRPHGAAELQHPEVGFYMVGMKSYGRAPTFLLLTGYEQVRSVVAAIAGDKDAAARLELVLPETGVCNTDFASRVARTIELPVVCGTQPQKRARSRCC